MLLKFYIPLLFLTALTQTALAQQAFVPDSTIPQFHEQRVRVKPLRAFTESDLLTSPLPQQLKQSLQRYSNISKKSCDSPESADYVLSLTIKGDYKLCADYVSECLSQSSVPAATVIQGARCAALDYDYQKAYSLFNQGLNSAVLKSPEVSAYILEFSLLAQYSLFSDKTNGIINSHPNWNADQKKLALGLVELAGHSLPTLVSKAQVFAFVEQELQTAGGYYLEYLKNLRISLFYQDFQTEKAYSYLMKDAASLTNPLDWWSNAFNIFYEMSNGTDFSQANSLYQAFLPFAHDRSKLPVESNIYTYTQIYNETCKSNMLQGADSAAFKAQINSWKKGALPLAQLLKTLSEKPQSFFQKSDFLSTYASLLSIDAQYDKAQAYYWQAHKLCAYNNRSHWGLQLLQRRKKYQVFPEYKANEALVDSVISRISFPLEIKDYFYNWNSLPPASQNRVKYASRIWAAYLKPMLDAGSHSYIKLPFEALSDSPGLADLKDERISYAFDYRLWDDVRGAGGQTVAADHDEVFQTVQGDYNLLGHEMAHQFHAFVETAAPVLSDCINKLYAGAQARDLFADGYAKSNVREYFAQGITYYLIPADRPARYGVNVSWFQKNDTDLYKFMLSIEQANGDLTKISCPL